MPLLDESLRHDMKHEPKTDQWGRHHTWMNCSCGYQIHYNYAAEPQRSTTVEEVEAEHMKVSSEYKSVWDGEHAVWIHVSSTSVVLDPIRHARWLGQSSSHIPADPSRNFHGCT